MPICQQWLRKLAFKVIENSSDFMKLHETYDLPSSH